MKQIYFTLLFSSFYLFSLAQGNVGIGTTAPTQKLDVDGQIRIRGGGPSAGLVLTATDNNGNAIWGEATAHTSVSAVATNGSGWRRVAHIDGSAGRGFGTVTIYTTGGSYTPRMLTINWSHDWSSGAGLTLSSESPSTGYWSEARITDDGSNAYIEVNFTSDITTLAAISSNYGWRTATLYSGTLPTGAGNVRVTATTANLNVGENALNVAFNGEVGIGVANPGAKLDISSTSSIGIKLNSSYGSDHWLLQTNTNGSNYSGLWETSDDIRLLLRDDAGNIDVDMRPDGDSYVNGGNLGVGNTSPTQKLHVTGSSLVTDRTYIGSTDSYFYRDAADRIATPDQFYVQSSSPNTYLYSTNTYLGATSGDATHLRGNNFDWNEGVIQGDGNVGVGTTNPTTKLEVTGGSGAITSIKTDGYAYDVSGVIQGNYVPSHSWSVGTGSVGIFGQNGSTSENSREWGLGPHGNRVLLWKATPDASSDADGGWNSTNFAIDHTKAYRVSVWIKKTGTTDGSTYLGCLGGHTNNLNGSANNNPYFFSGDLPSVNKWYLVVGYIHGSGDASTTSYGGIYDGETGEKVASTTDFKFPTSATLQRHRSYLYYNTTTSNRQYWWDPRFEEVNGKEPSIQALLGVAPGSTSTSQGATTYNSTSEANLTSNNTGSFSYSAGAGWTPGTWQTVSGLSVTRSITSGNTVLVTLTARIEGDRYNYYVPSAGYFRIMRGSTEIARSAVYLSPADYVPNYFWYNKSSNLAFNIVDTGVSGSQTYSVQYWLPNEYSGTESIRIGERYMSVIELHP